MSVLQVFPNTQIAKILVRTTNWIGDAVMTTPALRTIRTSFPQAEVVVVANPLVAQLFKSHPDCDRVLIYDRGGLHQGLGGFLRFCSQLRREGFDLAILLQNAFEAALLASIAGIPRRAGYRTDGRRLLLTHGVPVVDTKHGLHHVDYYQHMLRSLGFSVEAQPLRLALTAEEQKFGLDWLGTESWIAVNPGASYGSAKRWIPERFAAVADELAADFGLRVLLTGGPGEKQIGADIEKAMHTSPLNLIGRTSVRELMALLARCRLLVTNDSGPMHVAAAFGVPIVAVFGPTDHSTTSPASEHVRIVRSAADCAPCLLRECPTDHRCMQRVTADQVLVAARQLLEAQR